MLVPGGMLVPKGCPESIMAFLPRQNSAPGVLEAGVTSLACPWGSQSDAKHTCSESKGVKPLKRKHPDCSLEHSQVTSGCAEDKLTPLKFEHVVASPAKFSSMSHSTSLQP